MDYVELTIPVASDEQGDILIAGLADFPFEGFEQASGALKAYIPMDALAGCKAEVDALLQDANILNVRYIEIESRNWNALWESNFEPVEVDRRLRIRAPFHAPDSNAELEIVIMPKMSFGTGHHATTRLMAAALLDMDVRGKRGLDMGSGTGVLAIIAARRGAVAVDAIDNDRWAHENAIENIIANEVEDRVSASLGDVRSVVGKRYDFILANINLNVLMSDLPVWAEALETGGTIVMSGILSGDTKQLIERANSLNLKQISQTEEASWACMAFEKR